MRGEPVAVLTSTSTGTDSSGEPIPSAPAQTIWEGCAVWPLTSEEIIQIGGDPVVTYNNVAFPAGVVVAPDDQLLVRGSLFQVVGAAQVWINPYTLHEPGVIVRAKRVTGDGS